MLDITPTPKIRGEVGQMHAIGARQGGGDTLCNWSTRGRTRSFGTQREIGQHVIRYAEDGKGGPSWRTECGLRTSGWPQTDQQTSVGGQSTLAEEDGLLVFGPMTLRRKRQGWWEQNVVWFPVKPSEHPWAVAVPSALAPEWIAAAAYKRFSKPVARVGGRHSGDEGSHQHEHACDDEHRHNTRYDGARCNGLVEHKFIT